MPIGAFRLNTISAALEASGITATGGTLSYYKTGSSSYRIHTFTTTGSNNFVVTGSGTADILLVGGGGGGGSTGTFSGTAGAAGGGGGGVVVYQTGVSISTQTYTISVGAGGAGAAASSSSGTTGGSSTGLGYTAGGGGGGSRAGNTATNGGGASATSSNSFTATAGTYAYKGGNGFASSTATNIAGGGGAGAGGAGVNGASADGGDGGLPIQNNIDGNNYYYAGGGGGGGGASGSTLGRAYSNTGVLQTTSSYGVGKSNATTGNGSSATNSLATYGGGGGGAYSGVNLTGYIGGDGKQGIAIVRYPVTNDFVYFVTSVSSSKNGTTVTVPTVEDGDIGILFQGADNSTTTAPTAVNPTNWTSVVNSSQTTTAGLRIQVHYKILTAAESNTTINCMSGTFNSYHTLVIYRPSKTYTLSIASLNQQATASAPTNQTLTMASQTTPFIGVAFSYSSGNANIGSTTTPTRTAGQANNGNLINLYDAEDSSVSFANSTISMTDAGQQGLASFRLVLT